MRMIYGSVAPGDGPVPTGGAVPDAESRAVDRMMAAMADCPWDEEDRRSLPGARTRCTLAAHVGSERRGGAEVRPLLPRLGRWTIAADVRLDNRGELCAALEIGPEERESLDDAGLILRAYRRWSAACVEHLRGDFAFAIWDEDAERLFCARDLAGTRPFYYCHAPGAGRFICAGDLRAIVAHPAVPRTLNRAYLLAYLQTPAGQFQHPAETFYQEIHKLPPAHCLTVDRDGLRGWAYWRPDRIPERRHPREAAYVEELLSLLTAAVSCRVDRPFPVGAHVSGGLDSSSLAVLAHRERRAHGSGITGFSWAPPPVDPDGPPPHDERILVEAVRRAEGFPVRYTVLTSSHLLAHTRRDITVQPTAALRAELVASEQAAGLGIRTLVSGWGGDELLAFGGRGYLPELLRRGRWITLRRELARRRLRQGGSVWRHAIGGAVLPLLPTAIWHRLRPDDSPGPLPLPAMLRPEFAATLFDVEPLTQTDLRERPGVRRNQITLLQHGHLSYRMESWAAHGFTLGLTYAYPLLDQRVVEFALSIPGDLFYRDGWRRYLYRTAMAGILPDRVRWHAVKEDLAMAEAHRQAREDAAGLVRTAILARADNPFVDVARLAEVLAAEGVGPSPGSPDGLRLRRRLFRKRAPLQRAVCLAFAAAVART